MILLLYKNSKKNEKEPNSKSSETLRSFSVFALFLSLRETNKPDIQKSHYFWPPV